MSCYVSGMRRLLKMNQRKSLLPMDQEAANFAASLLMKQQCFIITERLNILLVRPVPKFSRPYLQCWSIRCTITKMLKSISCQFANVTIASIYLIKNPRRSKLKSNPQDHPKVQHQTRKN